MNWKQGLIEIFIHSWFIEVLFAIAKVWKQPMNGEANMICTHNGIFFSLKRREVLIYATA